MYSKMGAVRTIVAFFVILLENVALALPVVSDVTASQRTDGSGMVDIYYGLSGGVGTITVTLEVSNDGGSTWTITPQAQYLSGDIGSVANGTGKHIVWNMIADRPGVCWPDTRFKVVANDEDVNEGEGEPGDELTVTLPGDVPLVLVYVPAGTFLMGRYSGEQDSYSYEDPQHSVTLTQDFYLGKYELTKRQWQAVMGTTPWSGLSYVLNDLDSPAVYVSWNDAQSFITALNTHISSTGQGAATFRLPTEAEWEYACRAGTTTRFYWGDDPSYTQISDYAWWAGNAWNASEEYAHVVGLKLPNAFGLYDMSGNVFELCEDDWHGSYTGAPTDGSAWVDSPRGSDRLLRGGSWSAFDYGCRSALRYDLNPDLTYLSGGFRVVRTP